MDQILEKAKARQVANEITAPRLSDQEIAERQERQKQLEAKRLRAKCIDALARCLGCRYSPERVSLDRYQVYHTDQGRVVERLRQVLKNLPAMVEEGRGLVFYGAVGTGKDHLLASALYQAAEHGIECHWLNGQELYGQFRDRMDTGDPERELVKQLTLPPVLAISDPIPPVGDLTAWNMTQFARIIDHRYREMKSTWVSLNATDLDDADARLSSPVLDRLQECSELFPCFWQSWRERNRQKLAS
jgi:DNA replication protein DnaC